ncbi:MAG: hypothetical protein CMI29_04550 [Opitutae bacterium]|nr:hypothetical protein [Opitutae bacterium]|tara:strand:+ start:302 stop:577 length:276 start_codon:yes stop_codon:yes gene_type:complete
MNVVTIVVWAGIASLVVAFSIVGGIIANLVNDGDNHKETMTKVSPPPPSAPPARMMRAMTEYEEIYGKGPNHFLLTKDEHKLFATLTKRLR